MKFWSYIIKQKFQLKEFQFSEIKILSKYQKYLEIPSHMWHEKNTTKQTFLQKISKLTTDT